MQTVLIFIRDKDDGRSFIVVKAVNINGVCASDSANGGVAEFFNFFSKTGNDTAILLCRALKHLIAKRY